MPVALDASRLRRNSLLAALPKRDLARIGARLRPVQLDPGDTLYEPEGSINHVYFPTSGLVTLLFVLEDGPSVEVGRVGSEGIVGLPVFFGVPVSHTQAVVQISGEALRMRVADFRREARQNELLDGLLLRYAQALMHHSNRIAACNIWHSVEQRLCRWLLITHDRVRADQLDITQAFLAQMLGVHRQSVTLAAVSLQKAGAIRYSRGRMTIVDRSSLESCACACYQEIRRKFEELLLATGA